MKIKKCKFCGDEFEQARPMQNVCSPDCAYKLVEQKKIKKAAKAIKDKEKELKKHLRESKEKLKTKGQLAKEAQAAFNKYVRLRDKDLPCISCGRHHQGQYHAGHYRSVGSAPHLRFNLWNNHRQCAPCNTHLSGNLINYRMNLIKRIGEEKVDWLESANFSNKYSEEYLRRIKKIFTKKYKSIYAP
jgi:hypothetical protein